MSSKVVPIKPGERFVGAADVMKTEIRRCITRLEAHRAALLRPDPEDSQGQDEIIVNGKREVNRVRVLAAALDEVQKMCQEAGSEAQAFLDAETEVARRRRVPPRPEQKVILKTD